MALEIVRDIVDHDLQTGDRLPHEPEMLAQYRVSRSSLREALRLLETQGLIAIRPGAGAGTVVGEAAPSNLGRTLTLYLHMSDGTYDDLLKAWMLTEPLLAGLAAANPDREWVREVMEPFLATHDGGPQRDIPSGLAFHDAVAELSDNRTLALTLRAIGFIVSDHVLMMKDRDGLETFIVDDHCGLAQAIIDGDSALAQRLMAEHVRHVVDDFRAFWPRRVGQRVTWR
ncbi:DNA-binding FadR family transcriptional regulator [Caulobacter ginsengisoli]|uniref:DNA-binding FadR family transcriptional regulator n=1 Tax=Caulobacter ginsengisoli TaxID=400775 RepID=A0ABU0IZW8_9CAUL|nr:GntR family transcriptional regulator [Caulobacter ginsengisoli]MDQ0466905.1 DNA-binding FadR family transcriptional regulator [Caulobacter ginsengisoli]